MLPYKNIAVIADKSPLAREAFGTLERQYNFPELTDNYADYDELDAIIVLGGDGFMLHIIHKLLEKHTYLKPIYGMNCGTVGFLLNEFDADNLHARLSRSTTTRIHPLKMTVHTDDGKIIERLAINEVSLLRASSQAAHIDIFVDGTPTLNNLICDGVLVATPAGSTAYNFSVGGAIIPLNADLIALTPISAFRPKRWHGALLPHHSRIEFTISNPQKRPVTAVADFIEVKNAVHIAVETERNIAIQLLFDSGHSLEERIIREQFRV